MRRCLLLPGLLAVIIAAPGCFDSGPKTYPVSGTVTFDGEQVPDGDILFVPDNKALKVDGGKIRDGKFQFQATQGKKRVEIRATRRDPTRKNPMGEMVPVEYIPDRYNTQSILSKEVSPDGPNAFEFALTTK
jgi:hypothetical protein